jgi:hypothetical protein
LIVADENVVGVKPEPIEVSFITNDSGASTISSSMIGTITYCFVPLLTPALKITFNAVFEKSSGDSAEPSSVKKLWEKMILIYKCRTPVHATCNKHLLKIVGITATFLVTSNVINKFTTLPH